MGMSDNINKLLTSSVFQSTLREIEYEAIEELKQSIWDNFYMTYEPSTYIRSYQFLNSARGELSVTSNAVELKIFLDPNLMEHPSVVDGENSYVPPLLYYGHQQSGYNNVDYFHNYPARTEWWDNAVKQISEKVRLRVGNAIITAITSKRYR